MSSFHQMIRRTAAPPVLSSKKRSKTRTRSRRNCSRTFLTPISLPSWRNPSKPCWIDGFTQSKNDNAGRSENSNKCPKHLNHQLKSRRPPRMPS